MSQCQQRPQKSPLENRQAANRSTAIAVPALLIGIVGYVTWIVVVLIGVNYLIKHQNRHGAGIAIIVLYFIFLFPMASTYLRLLMTIPHPGYIEKGSPTAATPVKPAKEAPPQHNIQASCTSTTVQDGANETTKKSRPAAPQEPPVTLLDTKAILSGEIPPPPGTEQFYSKDVFACDQNGLPIWCGTCNNWKPDRSHHGSDVGRCVLKMDHFCPWVGGVVGERNFNFFIQFCSYAGIYALFVMIVMAVFIAEARSRGNALGGNWIAGLTLGAVFTLFAGGMAMTSIGLALKNLTTIDNIGHQRRVMHIAVLVDSTQQRQPRPMSTDQLKPSHGTEDNEEPWQGTITYPLSVLPDASSETTLPPRASSPPRTFAILRTHAGMNPWNLGAFKNFKSIMGNRWYDWFLPLRHSPCCNHDRGDSMYELGPDVDRLKVDAGLSSTHSKGGSSRRKHRKHRHHREDSEDVDIMGSTLANVNGVTGREQNSFDSV
ncbi:zf-DHHC-domain-containing protein [Aureobasidium subglaciale]|nr:zf-DHHC-domain-containing protein [Aureobasidium subglaciale]